MPEPLATTRLGRAARLVVLVSGSGTLLQALIDACADPAYGAQIVAVGSDRPDVQGLTRAEQAEIPTFVLALPNYPTRAEWDQAMTAEVAAYEPDLVISAGFMKLLGAEFLDRFEGRIINTHPALLPSFPGMHGPRDALAYGVKITGATVFLVDSGVDSGVILDQQTVPVAEWRPCTKGSRSWNGNCSSRSLINLLPERGESPTGRCCGHDNFSRQ